MTKDELIELIKTSTIGKRMYVTFETCNPDVITPSEVDELAETIMGVLRSEAPFDWG